MRLCLLLRLLNSVVLTTVLQLLPIVNPASVLTHWLHSQDCWAPVALILGSPAPPPPHPTPVPFLFHLQVSRPTWDELHASRLHRCKTKTVVAEFAAGECTVAAGSSPATARDEWVFAAMLKLTDSTVMSWFTNFFNFLVVVRDYEHHNDFRQPRRCQRPVLLCASNIFQSW